MHQYSMHQHSDLQLNRLPVPVVDFKNVSSFLKTRNKIDVAKFRFLMSYKERWPHARIPQPSLEETYGESICLECCIVWKRNVDSTKRRYSATRGIWWRRMMKVPWTEHKTNEEILQMVETQRKMMDTVRSRQKTWLDHIMRHDSLLRITLEDKYRGSRLAGDQEQCFWIGYWKQRKAISITKN